MKRLICWLLVVAMVAVLLPAPPAAMAEAALVLPESTELVAEEAFQGDTSLSVVIIPKTVKSIGSKAFANCTNLTEVFLGNNPGMEIAEDAFEGCGDLVFNVFPETSGELYAYAHGYLCYEMEEGSSFLQRAMTLVAENGGSTILQSGEFASKRLLVCRKDGKLPNISAHKPTEIIRDDEIFAIQFDTVDDAVDCYTTLINDTVNTVFVEPDQCVEALDGVSAAGVVSGEVWDTEDPMGFDVYSQFVAENGQGGVTIAVVDSGVRKLASYSSKLRSDGINMLKAQDGEEWYTDNMRHGSVIASVIGDCTGNANVSILPVRVVGDSGNTNFTMIGNGINYAVSKGASIINLSMNFKSSAYVTHCINQAVQAGVTVIVAAGNAGKDVSNVYPANLSNVVTVGGLGKDYKPSVTTNYGAAVDYYAPDSFIKTSAFTSSLSNGTSFAAPMVASAYALVSLDPYHTIADMNATCFYPSEASGQGMPRVDQLAKILVKTIAIAEGTPDQLAVGEQIDLNWTVDPVNATDKTVTAASSQSNVLAVTVDETGAVKLEAKTTGTATVTLTSNSSDASASKTFTVVQPVQSLVITGAAPRLCLGRTMKLEAVVSPANATTKAVEWVSTNEAVAKVSADGVVTPVALGTVGIYAKATDGYGAKSSTVSINVVDIPDPEGIVLKVNGEDVTNGKIRMAPGETVNMQISVLPEDADQEVVITPMGSLITVSNTGVITAKSAGTGYVYVTTADKSISATLEVQVVVLPTSITISGNTVIDEGTTSALTVKVLPDNVTDGTVTWSSGNQSVATVSSTGVVTGVKEGTAVITATANGDPSVTKNVTVTVRHPFTVKFDVNAGSDTTAKASSSNMVAYSGYAVGTLPTATRDYYNLDGWYTAASGGTKITDTSAITCSGSEYTLYAHWSLKPESGWVLPSAVPSNGKVTQTSYSYRESTESTNSTASGWVPNGSYWKQTGTGSKYYATFPSGYNTSHWTYTDYMKSPYTASETATNKRTVTNVQEGWIYWHWMYNVAYANNTHRAIYNKSGNGPDNNFAYRYFYAIVSNTDCPYLDNGYCNSLNLPSYNCVNIIPSNADKSATSGLGTPRFFRFNRYKSTYVDSVKTYKYYRDISYSLTDPGSGSTISNKVTYVKYRLK